MKEECMRDWSRREKFEMLSRTYVDAAWLFARNQDHQQLRHAQPDKL